MTKLVGILNVTEDSFSDGGVYFSETAAIAQAVALRESGAAIVELGPAASNPDASQVTAEVELERLTPLFPKLKKLDIPFGVDSPHPIVQLFAAAQGAVLLNDIRGFPLKEIYRDLRVSGATLVVMHAMQAGGQASREPFTVDEVLTHLWNFFDARLEALLSAGIPRERIVLDPGMGFFLSSLAEPSVALLNRLPELEARYRCELFISVSRKSFVRDLGAANLETCGPATLAAELFAVQRGATFIRTHDVASLVSALKIDEALRNYKPESC
jgi:dihydropteroate synthase type 2